MLGESLRLGLRMRSSGHFQKLFQHLLSPGTWPCSLRGSLSPRKAPDTNHVPRRTHLLPRGGTRAALTATLTHGKLPRSPLSWSLRPTHTCSLRVPDHLSHPLKQKSSTNGVEIGIGVRREWEGVVLGKVKCNSQSWLSASTAKLTSPDFPKITLGSF